MAGIALGLASRPTYDAAEALIRNKQIEYDRELRLKQMAQQAKLARQQQMMQMLGMFNQNMQQQAAQANQRAMQQEAIQARMQEQERQLQAQDRSLLERQFNQMHANWQAQIAKAEQNNMGFDPAHQPRMNAIKEAMLKIDQEMAAGNIDPANGFRQKMALLQQLATFKPDTRIKTLQEQMQERMIRVGPNGQILGPNDPPMQGERLGTVNDKGVFDPFTPLPAPKPDPAVAAQQKMVEAMKKEESRLTKEFDQSVKKILENAGYDEKTGNSLISREQAESRVRQEMKATARQFERTFGTPHPELTEPAPQPLTPQQRGSLQRARQAIKAYGDSTDDSPGQKALMEWAKKTVETLAPLEAVPSPTPQAVAPMPVENLNGQPLNDFARYALSGPGRSLDESTFPKSPVANHMTFEEFDAARSQLESQVPKINTPSEASQLAPGALFFNDRGELLQNIPNPQPKPPRGSSPRGGAGGGGRPPGGAGGGSGAPKPGPDSKGAPPQQQPPKRGMPIDRILGSGDGKDRRGNVPPRTQLILKKGDPNNQKLFDEVISKLTPEQAKQLFVAEVDPSQPAGPDNRMDLVTQHDARAFPFLVREEWDGKKYVKADVMIAPRTSEVLGEFMKNGKLPPPPNGVMAHTYVILDAADKTGAAEKWATISNQMTDAERSNVSVFKIDSRLPDSPTNDLSILGRLKIDPSQGMPVVIRGEWNGEGYKVRAESRGPKAMEPLKDIKSYRDFSRPDRDLHAEGAAIVAAEDAKALEDAKVKQVTLDAESRERLGGQFDKNVRTAGNPLGSMKVPAAGEAGYENFKRAYREWMDGRDADGLDYPNKTLDQLVAEREASAVNTPEKAQAILRAYNDPKNPLNAENVAEARRIIERAEAVQRLPTAAEREAAKAGQKVLDIQAAQTTVARENPKFPIPRGQDKRLDAAKDLLREAGDPPKVTPQQSQAAREAVAALKDRDRALTPNEESQVDGAKELIRKAESPKNPTNPQRVSEAQAVIEKATAEGQQPAGGEAAQQSTARGNIPAALPQQGARDSDIQPSPSAGVPQPRDGATALQVIQAIGRLSKSSVQGDRDKAEVLHQQVQRWADNTLSRGNTKIGGYDLIGEPKASKEDSDIAKDIKQAAGLPQGTGVLQGLKQINEGRMNPVSIHAARDRLQQRIDQMLRQQQSQLRMQQQGQRSQQQDRARQEQQRLTAPPSVQPRDTSAPVPSIRPQTTPMQRPMSSLPPLQPSRTQQLREGVALGVMKPGMLNLDTINEGLTAMTGPRPQPYTGGILGGMQKPRQEPSNELGMMFPQAQQLGNPYAPPGGFVGQPGYMGNFGGYGYGGGGGDSFAMTQLDGTGGGYGYYPPSIYDYGEYNSPVIDVPYSSYGLSDQYSSSVSDLGYGSGYNDGYGMGASNWDLMPDQVYDPYSPTMSIGPAY